MDKTIQISVALILLASFTGHGQAIKKYYAGFKTLKLVDVSRNYKPNTADSDSLHYRPVDLDIWYPSSIKGNSSLSFGDLFNLFEQRANQYQDTDYTGIVKELAQLYTSELGVGGDGVGKLLGAKTSSYANAEPSKETFPLILYMAGLNGMGFENVKILESLAESGFIVASVWSVGRYPGDMTNHKLDMMEQVYDAEFILDYLKSQNELIVNNDSIGVLACSWGGMSAAVLADRKNRISTFVSLDGTETHYFGESDQNDGFIREIYHSNLLNPENKSISYLYLESGNKLDEYSPTEEYNYYKKLNSIDKHYLRLLKSKHEDFTSIPSILQASQNAVETYEQILQLTTSFFENHMQQKDGFNTYYNKLSLSDAFSTEPFDHKHDDKENIVAQGEISDAKTGLALAYVNIGVLNKEIGTVSNEAGKFELQIKSGMGSDTVRVSMIGYKAKTFPVRTLLSHEWNKVELEEEIGQLDEVVITSKGLKKGNLGNKTTSKFIGAAFSYDKLGSEMGIKINTKKKPAFVDTFNFNISYNRLSAKALFRLNIYEVERGRPSKNIMTDNILIPIDAKQTGLVSVDLTEYNIVLKDDVIATLEWVKNEGENNKGEGIYFSLGVFNGGTFHRRSSQGKFKKLSNLGVGMNFDVRY